MRSFAILLIFSLSTSVIFAQTNRSVQTTTSKPFILGSIEEIQSNQLGEKRILNIYLPDGYTQDDTTHYPVIYLLDGSADEDFIHIVGLVQFNNFSWINRVPKSIVVGIANTDRKRDFTYPTTIVEDKMKYPTTGHSDRFIAFVEKELQPFIDGKYKTNGSRMIIGQSLGGLVATEILFKKPYLFNKYIIISPSLWWDNGSLLDLQPDILREAFSQKTDIYIGVGKEGIVTGKTPHVMEVDANFLADKIKRTKSKNINVYFDYLPQEDHATIEYQAVFNAFRMLYPAPSGDK
ncbi:MAG: alpha/beta hydrolase-fold protein [Saprospiraceae bacterium]